MREFTNNQEFQIIKKLSGGINGKVYKIQHNNKLSVLKIYPQENGRQRCQREIQ